MNIDPTRIGTYRRILAELEEKHRRGLIDELLAKHGFAIVANVLFESTEVVDIYEGLSGLDQDVSGSLRKFTAGCTLLTDERRRGNNVARNVGFELGMAAFFRRSGFSIRLMPPADLWVQLGETTVAIECKRPFSYDGLGGNLDKAFSQLRERYRNHPTPSHVRGIVALSASKMENDGSRMLKADNVAELNSSVRQLSNDFVTKTASFWDNARDERTIGLVVSFRALSPVEDVNLFTVAQHFTWIGLAQSSSDREVFRSVSSAFNKLVPNAKDVDTAD